MAISSIPSRILSSLARGINGFLPIQEPAWIAEPGDGFTALVGGVGPVTTVKTSYKDLEAEPCTTLYLDRRSPNGRWYRVPYHLMKDAARFIPRETIRRKPDSDRRKAA